MRSYLPFVLESTTLFVLIFVMITQVVIPLWIDLHVFWLFRKSGRDEINRRYRKFMGYPPKPTVKPPEKREWCCLCLVRHAEGQHVHTVKPSDK